MRVSREVWAGVRLVVKQADSPSEQRRVDSERRILVAAAHPGVAQAVAAPAGFETALATREVPGGDLSARMPLEVGEVLGLGAAVANVLADLHDLGIVHGAVCAEHILLDHEGCPVLCGFGAASRHARADELARAAGADVASLAATLLAQVGHDYPRSVHRVLQAAMSIRRARARSSRLSDLVRPGLGVTGARRCDDARRLAHALSRCEGARLPSATAPETIIVADQARSGSPVATGKLLPAVAPEARPGTSARVHRGRLRIGRAVPPEVRSGEPDALGMTKLAAAVAAALALCLVAVIAVTPMFSNPSRATPGSAAGRSPSAIAQTGGACPVVDAGCGPVGLHDGVLNGSKGLFQLGQEGDVVVIGRWHCGQEALPALLRPASGQIWVFDRWASGGADVAGRLLDTVADSTSLRVVPAETGCDSLEVVRGGGLAPDLLSAGGLP